MPHHNLLVQHILTTWADELSAKLHRPKAQILQAGLFAGDFSANEELTVSFPDGSSIHFRHALLLTNIPRRELAVFTEHCGYHVFPAYEAVIERTTREWFTA